MNEWSPEAHLALESALANIRRRARAAGADPDEVEADVRAHVARELGEQARPTAAELERVLAAFVTPASADARIAAAAPSESAQQAKPSADEREQRIASARRAAERAARGPQAPSGLGRAALILFGIVLPSIALSFELCTHACAEQIFDPLPSPWNVLMVASVPIACAWSLHIPSSERWRSWLAALQGFAFVAASYYSILFLPIVPVALIAMVMGIGILPLSPLLALIGLGRARKALRSAWDARQGRGLTGTLRGVAAGLALVAMLWGAPLLASYGLQGFDSSDGGERARALWVLRHLVPEDELLRQCYASPRSAREPALAATRPRTAEELGRARSAFWRATGTSFNAHPRPEELLLQRSWEARPGLDPLDLDRGGIEVGGRAPGLELSGSRLDGLLEADAACAYLEWTLSFRNRARSPSEARCELLLPPGASVSRLTLWIDGQPREAAFAATAQVREAYREVVQVQRRDPALVTSCGPDRVRLQCFPVAGGRELTVRLGITAPLELLEPAQASCELPRIVERNFDLDPQLQRATWLRSERPLSLDGVEARPTADAVERFQWSGELGELECSRDTRAASVSRDPEASACWSPSGAATETGCVLQQLRTQMQNLSPLIVVVDGSSALREYRGEIADALAGIPPELDVGLIAAQDEPRELLRAGPHARGELVDAFESVSFAGGCDNADALALALERAGSRGAVLWLHGAQAWLDAEPARLLQLGERDQATRRIWSAQLGDGRQRLLERLPGALAPRRLPRAGRLVDDLARFAQRCAGQRPWLDFGRELVDAAALPASARGPVSPHVGRVWARERVEELARGGAEQRARAASLASECTLVSSVSGAVVLETAAQYARNGLEPVDPDQAPSVPEPRLLWLLALGLAALAWTRAPRRAA